MARALIVGCGCRGLALARSLQEAGHVVRGSTRRPERLPELEAAGVDGVVADPYRLATLLHPVEGVSVVCWLMGSAEGSAADVAALHDTRLRSMLETLVDTHARAFVYEAAGSVPRAVLEGGAAIAREAAATFEMPVEVVSEPPEPADRWVAAMRAAVESTLLR